MCKQKALQFKGSQILRCSNTGFEYLLYTKEYASNCSFTYTVLSQLLCDPLQKYLVSGADNVQKKKIYKILKCVNFIPVKIKSWVQNDKIHLYHLLTAEENLVPQVSIFDNQGYCVVSQLLERVCSVIQGAEAPTYYNTQDCPQSKA